MAVRRAERVARRKAWKYEPDFSLRCAGVVRGDDVDAPIQDAGTDGFAILRCFDGGFHLMWVPFEA